MSRRWWRRHRAERVEIHAPFTVHGTEQVAEARVREIVREEINAEALKRAEATARRTAELAKKIDALTEPQPGQPQPRFDLYTQDGKPRAPRHRVVTSNDYLRHDLNRTEISGTDQHPPRHCRDTDHTACAMQQLAGNLIGTGISVDCPLDRISRALRERLQRCHTNLLTLHGLHTRYVAGALLASLRRLQRRAWVRRAADGGASDTTGAEQPTPVGDSFPDATANGFIEDRADDPFGDELDDYPVGEYTDLPIVPVSVPPAGMGATPAPTDFSTAGSGLVPGGATPAAAGDHSSTSQLLGEAAAQLNSLGQMAYSEPQDWLDDFITQLHERAEAHRRQGD